MDRRTFIGGVALGLLAAQCAEALQVGKVVRIGWLTPAVQERAMTVVGVRRDKAALFQWV